MRIQALIFGLVMWAFVGVAAFYVYGKKDQQTPAASQDDPTAVVVNPTGKLPIKILGGDPASEQLAPPGWKPPIVDGWTLVNHLGEAVTPKTLNGKPYVATFIFTRCQTHCPDLVRRVYDLEQRLKDIDVRFVTVSVDPDYDTVEHLAKYAEIFTDNPDRWMFLTGEKEQILNLARFGSRQMRTEPLDPETFIGPQAAHSLRLMHVGADGRLIGSYHFQKEEDMLALRRVLEGKAETRDEHKPLPASEEMVPVYFQQDVNEAPAVKSLDAVRVDPLAALPEWVRRLPPINATMNGMAAVFLIVGITAIKMNKPTVHRNAMVAAIIVSAVFLTGYAVYHIALGQYTDSHGKPFDGTGIWRTIYYGILIPHVILAATVPYFVGVSVYRAYHKRWDDHKRIAKVAFPVWMFVSVTGVVIYFMLYHWPVATSTPVAAMMSSISSHGFSIAV